MQSEVQCAEATVDDHLRNLIQLMKRGGRVSVTDIPNDPTFLSSNFGGPTVQAMAEKIEATLSPGAEPVAIYKGNGLIDCGDGGHHNIELLKLIPANTHLYMSAASSLSLSTDAEPVGTPIGFTDAAELNSDTGHGLFAYAGSDASWLSGPIPLYAKCPAFAQDRAEYERREQVCKGAALSQWERSLKRPDLDEKSRVIGAIEAFKRQAFAFTMLDAALSAQVKDVAVPEGWQTVPKEPTDEMHNAARDWAVKKYGLGIGRDGSDGCYRAMLAAAPAKQEGSE